MLSIKIAYTNIYCIHCSTTYKKVPTVKIQFIHVKYIRTAFALFYHVPDHILFLNITTPKIDDASIYTAIDKKIV